MDDDGKSLKKDSLLHKTGDVLKNNAKLTKDGMAYYLETMSKMPGAYIATSEHIKTDKSRKKGIKNLENIKIIRRQIIGAKDKTKSIGEWAIIAGGGTWDDVTKKRIKDFSEASNKIKEKIELFEQNYNYFVKQLLSNHEEEISAVIKDNGSFEGADEKRKQIIQSLRQIEVIGEGINDNVAKINIVEKNIESFIDNDLSGLKRDKLMPSLKQALNKRSTWIKRVFNEGYVAVSRVTKALKFLVMGLYYIARIFIFVVKYFILLPTSLLEKISKARSIDKNR